MELSEKKAINAKELQITFNKSVKEDTVVAATTANSEVVGTLVDDSITISSLDGKAVTANSTTASLSEDGKTLTLKATGAEVFSGRYDVKIAAGVIKTAGKEDIAKFETTIKAEDKVAPKVVATEKVTSTQYKVKFSEPIKSLGTATYKLADGTVLETADALATSGVRVDFTPGNDYATFTLGSAVAANKVVTATFVGLQDYALNLVDPNPTTVSFTKGAADGVAPTVTSLTAINNKTVEVKFSEELSANPVITGVTGTLTVTQDKTDKTKYTIKSDTAQSGLKSVTVSAGYTDLSGEQGVAYTKLVNFDIDTVAPKLVSSTVEKGSDNAEYLVLTFDENVTAAAGLATINVTGTATKDYVTTSSLPNASITVSKLVVDTENAKIARIKLADLVGSTNNDGTVYDLTLTGKTSASANNAIVDDISGNKGAQVIKASFTRSTDGTAANKNQATIDKSVDTNGIDVVDNNTLTVAFEQELDGASATNIANYSIDGATVEKAILNPASAGKQTVTLTLKANSNAFTGERNVTISGVKAKNGLAMDTYKTTEVLKENVAPTVTKAVLTGTTTIQLTFSEKVTNATEAVGDFDLYVGGVKVANTVTTAEQTTAANTITLTLGTALDATTIAKGLTLQAADSSDLQDEAGNIVSVPTAITVAQ